MTVGLGGLGTGGTLRRAGNPLPHRRAGLRVGGNDRAARRYVAATLAGWGLLAGVCYAGAPYVAYYGVAPIRSFTDETLTMLLGLNPLRLFPTLRAGTPPAAGDVVRGVLLLAAGALLSLPWGRLRRRDAAPREVAPLAGEVERETVAPRGA